MNTSEVQVVPENSSNRNPEVEVSESESEFDLNDPYHAIKQIFNCFDTDGDGFIDSHVPARKRPVLRVTDLVDMCLASPISRCFLPACYSLRSVFVPMSLTARTDLVEVCRHLGYDDDYADDILAQIGQDGFISYDAFAQFNRALLSNDIADNISDRADIWDAAEPADRTWTPNQGGPGGGWDFDKQSQELFEKSHTNDTDNRYAAHEDRVILFKDTGDKCRQCCKLQQELARTESEMVNILTEVQQARKTSKLMESLKGQLTKAEGELERTEIQLEQTVSELRCAKISQNEAGQLKDVYRKKCEAYLRQRKDIEEQINSGSLEGVMKVMKEPLTLDDTALGPESETREELVWRIQSYEEQIKQLSEENKDLRKRGMSPNKEEKKKEEEEMSLEQQLSDKAVISTEVSRAADTGVMDTDTASSLSEALQDCSSVRDVIKTLFSHGSAQVDKKMRERELQLERQNTKVEHLKSQIDVMALTLAESKGYADKLSMLVGQYDASNSALNLALKYTEMALEVSEVLNLLSDSEQNVLLANCNKAGPDSKLASGTGKVTIERKRAMNSRRQVEMRAKSLLQKLEKTLEDPSGVWETMSNSTHTSKHSNGASSVGSSQNSAAAEIEISQTEVLKFKEYKEQLKGHKNALKATILPLDTSILKSDSETPKTNSKTDLRLDLEHAVMLQELNCAKEERAEMKAMAYLAQQELRTLELRLEAAKLQEQGFKTQMSYYKTEWREELRKRRRLAKEVKARNTGEPNPEEFTLEMELSEALKREKKLKLKMAELTETIERLSRNAEMRHTQQGTYIGDLKRTNEALSSAYDKSKKKHALSLKKLEAQITQLVAQHERDVTKHHVTSSHSEHVKHDEIVNNRLSYFDERSCSSFGSQGHGEETEL